MTDDIGDQAEYLAAELSIPVDEARRYLENQRAYAEDSDSDD